MPTPIYEITRPASLGLSTLVLYAKGRAVLRPASAPVVKACRRYIGMAEPLLDLGDVGIVRQGIGSGRCAQRVNAQPDNFGTDARFSSVFAHDVAVHRTGIEVPVETAGAVVFDRAKQGTLEISAMPGRCQIGLDRPKRCRVDRAAPDFRHTTMRNLDRELQQVFDPYGPDVAALEGPAEFAYSDLRRRKLGIRDLRERKPGAPTKLVNRRNWVIAIPLALMQGDSRRQWFLRC